MTDDDKVLPCYALGVHEPHYWQAEVVEILPIDWSVLSHPDEGKKLVPTRTVKIRVYCPGVDRA